MSHFRHQHSFTLMEVMIAATILALAVVSTMAIVGGARSNLIRAEKRWARQHLLAQAVELYLLGGHDAVVPDGLLPAGFSSSCELLKVEDIHEEALEANRGWQLGEYVVVVYDASRRPMAECRVRKVLKEEDFE
ncbi:MAG: type II secretion system protein [Lentisphaerae bacterium]|nr:type II secretion system protein [Lentisphaerota bacterium]HQL86159.1 type II secretion system protein [Lentisphaeria bacterium]